MGPEIHFHSLIEGSLAELKERVSLQSDSDPEVAFYARVVLLFREGDLPELKQWIESHRNTSSARALLSLADLRVAIREVSVSQTLLAQHEPLAQNSSLWEGEYFFVIAMAYATLGDHEGAKRCYERSYRVFHRQGCERKSLKALLNCVVAETCIHPEKRLLNDFHFISRKAKALQEVSIEGIALLNISREYQKVGARLAALKYVNRAIKVLNEAEFGSIQYDLAIAHRCHLLFELGRAYEAHVNYEYIQASPFAEVKAALEVIAALRSSQKTAEKSYDKALLPTWLERLNGKASGNLTELEQTFLNLLSIEPKDKFELIQKLYGEKIEFKIAENRLNNLISRMRKKLPGLILFKNGKYELEDEIYLKREQRGA